MHMHVLLGLFLFSQAFSNVNGKVGDHGFCNQEQVKATFCIHCGSGFPDSIAVLIVESENDPNGNYQLQCVPPQWMCFGSMTETYNTTTDTLEIGFTFNHTIHGGRYLRIIRERNGSQENQQMLLKPCFSGFTTNASFYNESLITVSCQHSSFNYSNSPIRIKIEEGTEYGACSKTGCFGCKRLPDGIQCLVPYIPGKAIQCILDGAIYNISASDITPTTLSPEITQILSTTSQGTSFTSKDTAYTTQDTSYTSQDIKLSSASHEYSHISTSTSTEKSTPLQSVTTIPESSATSHKIITTTVQSSSLSQNLTTGLTEGSSTSKSITSKDNLPGSLNITTTSPNSLSAEQGIETSTEGSSTSKSITTDNLPGSLNITTTSLNSFPTEQGIATSTEGSKTSLGTNGSTTVKEETTTEYLGATVKPTNAPSNAITIINQNIIDQGFCHHQDVNIQLYLNCGIPFSATINVAIVASKHEINPNTILTCVRSNETSLYCQGSDNMTGYFNASSGLLDISFKFNFTIHAGYYVRVISSCEGNQETKHVHLIPCFTGFTVNATLYNETSLIIICQHSSFNYSRSPIRIKLKGGNDLGACSKVICNICKRLPDGIQCGVVYAPEYVYQCVLDGAIFNISLPTTPPEIQTTTPQNVSTSQRVSRSSENPTVSVKNIVTTTESSTTRIITSNEGSTTFKLITSTEDTILKTFESTFTESIKTTFSEIYSTTGSTASRSEETSTPENEIVVSSENPSTSRENAENTTNAPFYETTSMQSTNIITTASVEGATITMINNDVFDRGFCHLNDLEIHVQLSLGCKSHVCAIVDLSIVASVDDTYAYNLMTCLRFSDVKWNCHDNGIMGGKYNASSNVLDIRFNFNYTKYAGRYLRIKLFCVGDQETTHVLLKACFSEFNVQSSFYNETSLMINCQHSSFNYSSSLIIIKLKGGDDYGSCSKTMCNNCIRLSDGIQCIVPFTPGKIFQCILDGAVYNISIPANPVTQTTLPGTSTTSEKTTTISPNRSSSSQSMTSIIVEGSTTTRSLTSPKRLSTEQSFTTSLTNSTTEQKFGTTEPESPVTSPNTTPTSSDILSTSQNITTAFPSKSITSPNIIPTSPSIFSTSQRNTMMTTTLPETQTSRGSTIIQTTQSFSDHSIIIINKDVLDQGFCHLNGVNINLRVTCKTQYFATLNFSVVANEYETNETIFLSCVRSFDGTWICHGFGSMTGKYNASFGLLEIALNLNYTVFAGYYLRTMSSCDNIRDTKNINLKACFSGFTVNTTFYNESFINVRCQHSSFNYSNSPIRIKKGGNDYGACSRNSCNSCKRLPNGIECKVPYISGEELQCIFDGAIYNITEQNITSPGITTTILQSIATTQHTKTSPQISSTTSTGNSTESFTTTRSTPTTSPKSALTSLTSQNTPITSIESLTSMTSISTSTTKTSIPTTIIQATSKENITTTSIQATTKESKTTSSTIIPTTSQKSIKSTNIPTSSQESIPTTTNYPTTSQESIRTMTTIPTTFREIITTKSIPITSQESISSISATSQERTTQTKNMPTTSHESRTTTTNILTKSQESITTSIPKTYQESNTTPRILTTSHESITKTNIPTSSKESITTISIRSTSQESITTANIPTTSQESIRTTNISTISQENITTTNIPKTSQESKTTTTNIPTTSQESITPINIPTTSQESITTINIPTTSQENNTTPRIPTTSHESITKTNIPTSSKESITTTSIRSTFQESITTANISTTSQESIITSDIPTTSRKSITTNIPATSQESITTTNIPTTYQESITTTNIPTTYQESITTTNIPTTSPKSITTTNIPTTSQESKTTTNILTTSKKSIKTTNIPTTSQKSRTTSEIIPTTFLESKTTTANILTTSQESIKTKTSVPTISKERITTTINILTTSQESITTKTSVPTIFQERITTTTNIPTTSQRGITTMTSIPTPSHERLTTSIQTTFQESITTTKSNPTTQSIITSTKTSSETPNRSIKSTTQAEITYDSSGTSVVRGPLIKAAVFLTVFVIHLIHM